ncbi:hypothetical protein [Halostagnicola sp. A-GB9-2]|uniref:hypothetical protein n=1 Tax=Halostagnicola sp. A-GB9-2 TaxID=3048066 RepID=UPI0024C0C4C1|nr:hypothetical protein [Halostagnicola sp. A-GB9-2]MDJ1432234.1 hypothetical protein [Halostagnicola sp. A-GB9-2]
MASWISFVLSMVGTVGIALIQPDTSQPLTITDITDIPVFVLLGSWIGIWSSLLSYSVWSFWQLRRMSEERSRQKERNPFKRLYFLLVLAAEKVDDPTTYEERLQLTIQSFVFGTVMLVAPIHSTVYGWGR